MRYGVAQCRLPYLTVACAYQGLIQGKLDQRSALLEVKYAVARDICDENVDAMMEKLTSWCQSSEQLLASIDDQIRCDQLCLFTADTAHHLRRTL
jgi:hypothetical protein